MTLASVIDSYPFRVKGHAEKELRLRPAPLATVECGASAAALQAALGSRPHAELGRRGREHELDEGLLYLTSDGIVAGHIVAVDGGWTSV